MTKLGEYVLFTSVINPNVVRSIDGASEEQWETLFEGEVTTEGENEIYQAMFQLDTVINYDTIKVVYDGEEYTCNKQNGEVDNVSYYGAELTQESVDWSVYPFIFMSGESQGQPVGMIYTQNGGTHTLKIEAQESGGDSDGDNDFNIAEITFNTTIGTGSDNTHIYGIFLDTNDVMVADDLTPNDVDVIKFILYKGEQVIHIVTTQEVTVSGNIELTLTEEEGLYYYDAIITGDCTINCVEGDIL